MLPTPGSLAEHMSVHVILARTAKSAFAASDLFARSAPGPRILIYHQIGTDLGREMEVPTHVFVQQLDWMHSHGSIVELAQALDRRGDSGSDRLFSLGFDDGYADLYASAFPIMKERGIPFTLYLTTGPVETGDPMTKGGQADPLRWAEVIEMLGTGLVTIGAHTHSHPDMRGLSISQIEAELDTSNRLIEERTGVRPLDFAYPKGYWDAATDRQVRARYKTAVLGGGPPVMSDTDLYRLHRIPIQRSDGFLFFKRKLLTGMRLEETVRRKLHGYSGPT